MYRSSHVKNDPSRVIQKKILRYANNQIVKKTKVQKRNGTRGLGHAYTQCRPARSGPVTFTVGYLLGQHVTQLLLAEANLVDGLSSVLEGDVITVEVRGKKYFCIFIIC